MSGKMSSLCPKCGVKGGPFARFCHQCRTVLPLPKDLDELIKREREIELAQSLVAQDMSVCELMHSLSKRMGAKFCPSCGKRV